MDYVTYKCVKFEIKDGKLDLSSKDIKDMTEIKGFKTLNDLHSLDLSSNQII